MKFAVDLHIHTALSPCAESEMTPNNIVNMALLKELDIIAITDHNSTENVKAVMECAQSRKILVVPGMELETKEEVHLICLFNSFDNASKMQQIVNKELPDIKNRESIFGEQLIFDKNDEILAKCDRLLAMASGISIEDAFSMVEKLGGAIIPAHLDRESYSMISNLGVIPDNLGIKYLEISKMCDSEKYFKIISSLKKYEFIRSSDAHRLGDMLERASFIELEELSLECLIKELKQNV